MCWLLSLKPCGAKKEALLCWHCANNEPWHRECGMMQPVWTNISGSRQARNRQQQATNLQPNLWLETSVGDLTGSVKNICAPYKPLKSESNLDLLYCDSQTSVWKGKPNGSRHMFAIEPRAWKLDRSAGLPTVQLIVKKEGWRFYLVKTRQIPLSSVYKIIKLYPTHYSNSKVPISSSATSETPHLPEDGKLKKWFHLVHFRNLSSRIGPKAGGPSPPAFWM